MLTTRPLIAAPPPDEEWIVVGYRTTNGEMTELRLDWQVNRISASVKGTEVTPAAAAVLGFDLELDIVQRMRLALFAPKVIEAAKLAAEKIARGEKLEALETRFPEIFNARPVTTPSGNFGYLRIRNFRHWPPGEFVDEFIRLIESLPQTGHRRSSKRRGNNNERGIHPSQLDAGMDWAGTVPVPEHPAEFGDLPPQWTRLRR